jgi:hypothetical protein
MLDEAKKVLLSTTLVMAICRNISMVVQHRQMHMVGAKWKQIPWGLQVDWYLHQKSADVLEMYQTFEARISQRINMCNHVKMTRNAFLD